MISNAEKEKCKAVWFKGSTPYDEPKSLPEAWGYLVAFIDTVCQYRSKKESLFISPFVRSQYPNIESKPFKYLEILRKRLVRAQPKNDAKTNKMLDYIDKLSLIVEKHSEEENREALKDTFYLIFNTRAGVHLLYELRQTALTYYREKAGISTSELAEKTGIPEPQIIKFEDLQASTLDCADENLVKSIADVLGVQPEQLVDRIDSLAGRVVIVDPETGIAD